MSLDSDIDTIMDAFDAVTVIHNGVTGKGIEDIVDREMLGGVTAARGLVRFVQVRTSLFPTLAIGDPITVDGVASKVVDRERIDDGRITVLQLGTP